MPQFDVFTNPVPASRRTYPLVVSLQSQLFAEGSDQVVAPLAPRRQMAAVSTRISPLVRIDDSEYLVLVSTLVTLPARDLSHRVASLARHREELLGAIDLLFYGV